MSLPRFLLGPAILACTIAGAASPAMANEIEPSVSHLAPGGERVGRFSERTIVAAFEIDRDAMRLVSYTLKDRPFERSLEIAGARALAEGGSVQAEVILHDASGERYTQRVEAGRICLLHSAETPAHVQGDTIFVHRDAFVTELPELAGFDQVELAYHDLARGQPVRRTLGVETLDSGRFLPSGGPHAYVDLAFAGESTTPPPAPAANDILWPENFSDPDIYRLEGDESQVAKRINIVVVPDGYRYTEKSTMDAHFTAMVNEFRSFTPYKEHDPFVNYTLVYAYSAESGTDQCDCDDIRNTAMATGFPEAVSTCGHSDNRCLYYNGACEPSAISNIVATELRAPAVDATVVMVNTTRYGGCGGARGVYSAGDSAATQIAVHELGHSLGGLADEYSYDEGCGVFAGEVNTSKNALEGAWPEWIADIGAPREGAQYWQECIFRPLDNCEMRSLNQPFCPVCNQKWAKIYFSHFRVAPSAPVSSFSPGSFVNAQPEVLQPFEITTRLAEGPQVTNSITWRIQGPGFPSPTIVATDTTSYAHSFTEIGQYTVSAEVIADTNFIKPIRYDANVDTIGWQVQVTEALLPPEISGPGHAPFRFTNKFTVWWEEASQIGADSYNLYRGDVSALAGGDYGACLESGLTYPSTTVAEDPPSDSCWTYLIAGFNNAGEGPLGADAEGVQRTPGSPCP